MKRDTGIIGVDLDGTLAIQARDYNPEVICGPVPEMVMRVKHWLKEGRNVWILTARLNSTVHDAAYRKRITKKIERWCLKWIGQKLPVTSEKHPAMTSMYDDRAVRVQKNTGKILL